MKNCLWAGLLDKPDPVAAWVEEGKRQEYSSIG
jgi:hypothetical protein